MRSPLRSLFIGSLALLGAGGSALANSCSEDLQLERLGMISMEGVATAEPLTSREAISLISQGGSLTFQRRIDDFWRIKVKRFISPSDLDVRYQIAGGSDRAGFAVSTDLDNQRFPIRIIPIPPKVLCENNLYRIISGGFTAQARASRIGLDGFYEVEIRVDVSER